MRKWKCAVLAVLSAGAMVIGASPANPEPPKPGSAAGTPFAKVPADQRARIQGQNRARSAADRIRRAVERGTTSGFTGIELHNGSVRLWYKGTPPAAVRSAVDKARDAAPVEVLKARYSLAELQAASARMTQYLRTHPGGPAHRVSIAVDGSGLVVGTDAAAVATASRSLPDVGLPVRIEAQSRVHQSGRYGDVSPFYGGGAIVSNDGQGCTAGFGVRWGDKQYLLTAGHCGYPGQAWRNGDGSLLIGYARQENVANDLLMIEMQPPAKAGSYVFTGVGSSTSTGHVIGWSPVYTGEELCSSGAVTTWLCGHVVIDAGNSSYCNYDPYGNWECYSGLVWSRQENGAQAGRFGDSGGPVMLPTTSGIFAKGIISGFAGADLYWQDFATARQIWDGVIPVT